MTARPGWHVVAMLFVSLGACRGSDGAQQARQLDERTARRLAGAWTVVFSADPVATTGMRSANAVVAGALVLTEVRHGAPDVEDLRGITHEGIFDLDFRPFGFTSGSGPDIVVARLVAGAGEWKKGVAVDSVYLVLSPGTSRFAVRMAGILAADSGAGVWSANSFSIGGGAGTFVMRRSTGEPRLRE